MTHPLKALAMAVRNLLRGGRRTVSTLLAILVGLVGLTLLDGYITYSMNGLRWSVIHSGTGHIQVVKSPAFLDEGDSDPFPFMLDNAGQIQDRLRAMPQVADVVPAVSFTAVASANGKTTTVMVTALPTDKAARYLEARRIEAGKDLAAGQTGSILLGRGVARKLGVAPGAPVSLFALTEGGGVNTQTYGVTGTTATVIAALDNTAVFMDLSDAQALMGTQQVPQLIVFLKETADTNPVAAKLRADLGGLTIRTWEQLSPYYQQANSAYQLVLAVARFIVLIVALFSISGTLSLSVMERLREVGTLRAFGTRRAGLLTMFVWEGLALGLAGALVGCAAGAGISGLLNLFGGVTMPPQPGTSEAFRILFTPETSKFFDNALWVVGASIVGALFPGMLASRRKIADLLRA
ncbi:MAG TPA: FtsX-like permease family protein [Spirochaetia bacterium]|nr:FtsX-like permease family protein [Spirochaetia bacterium]